MFDDFLVSLQRFFSDKNNLKATFTVLFFIFFSVILHFIAPPKIRRTGAQPAADSLAIAAARDSIRRDSIARLPPPVPEVWEIVREKKVRSRGDSSKRLILLTGDSMGDGIFFALRKLRKKLAANDFEIKFVPLYSSKVRLWAESDTLTHLIEKNRPDLIIFTLGSNELFVPVTERKAKDVRKVLDELSETEFVWVGPPNWKKDWGTDSLFAAEVGPKNYFVSKDMKFKRARDGAHPTFRACEIWTDSIIRFLNQSPNHSFYIEPTGQPELGLSEKIFTENFTGFAGCGNGK